MLKKVGVQLIRLVLVFVTFSLLVAQNILTLILSWLVWTYLYKLWQASQVGLVARPKVLDWLVWTPLNISLPLFIIWLAFYLLGGYGIIGVIIILLLLAGFAIWQNWKLYDAVTLWGARVFKKGERRSFGKYYDEEVEHNEEFARRE